VNTYDVPTISDGVKLSRASSTKVVRNPFDLRSARLRDEYQVMESYRDTESGQARGT
jgi:hypothetical protein